MNQKEIPLSEKKCIILGKHILYTEGDVKKAIKKFKENIISTSFCYNENDERFLKLINEIFGEELTE